MGNGYSTQPAEGLDQLVQIIADMRRRLRELEALDGSQIHNTVQDLKNLLDGLINQVNGIFSGYVQAGGDITSTAGKGVFSTGVTSPAVYNNLVSATAYKVQYINIAGEMGYVPSSRRYKQDIVPAELDVRAIMRDLRVVTFRYIQAVELAGEDAAVEWGLIAEEVHDLGLYWLVDYDEDGLPNGLKHERWGVLLIMDAQDKQRQIDAIVERLDEAGI